MALHLVPLNDKIDSCRRSAAWDHRYCPGSKVLPAAGRARVSGARLGRTIIKMNSKTNDDYGTIGLTGGGGGEV